MLSKNKLKYIRSLALKKNRDAEQVFLAEGPKITEELAGHFTCRLLAGTAEYLSKRPHIEAEEVLEISPKELEQASQLKSPHDVLAVFRRECTGSSPSPADAANMKTLSLALDDVQDPGNLGTIIRLADWFGIEDIYCSLHTADAFAPKVVQATMGAIARVRIHYVNLPDFLNNLPEGTPVYGTFLEGDNLYNEQLTTNGILVMGNEGNGISKETERFITNRLFIPNYPASRQTSESLNVAVATAVACAEFRRQSFFQKP